MVTGEKLDSDTGTRKSSVGKLIVWLVIVTLSIGGGFATPLMVAKMNVPAEAHKEKEPHEIDPNEEVAFIDFPEVVAVLGKSKFSRYLKIDVSLQVPMSLKKEVEEKIESRSAVLRNRIISHIAEITEADLAGQYGHNQLRRQIHGFFNELLFEDGIERIQDVLFREFQVQ